MSRRLLTCLALGLGLALPVSAVFAAQPAPNTLSDQEKADGFQLLFDGKSLKGWHSYLQKGTGKDWKISDGAIVLEKRIKDDSADFADLVTDAEYDNFDLKLEWQMTPCADSGVMFYVHESPEYHYTWATGPEMQIADLSCTRPDSITLYERSGDLFDLISSNVEWVHESPQWNQFEIIAKDGHVQFFQNGHKVVETQLWDEKWKALVAGTKFAKMPGYAKYKKGHISLQGDEDKGAEPIRIAFRSIRIKPL